MAVESGPGRSERTAPREAGCGAWGQVSSTFAGLAQLTQTKVPPAPRAYPHARRGQTRHPHQHRHAAVRDAPPPRTARAHWRNTVEAAPSHEAASQARWRRATRTRATRATRSRSERKDKACGRANGALQAPARSLRSTGDLSQRRPRWLIRGNVTKRRRAGLATRDVGDVGDVGAGGLVVVVAGAAWRWWSRWRGWVGGCRQGRRQTRRQEAPAAR